MLTSNTHREKKYSTRVFIFKEGNSIFLFFKENSTKARNCVIQIQQAYASAWTTRMRIRALNICKLPWRYQVAFLAPSREIWVLNHWWREYSVQTRYEMLECIGVYCSSQRNALCFVCDYFYTKTCSCEFFVKKN